MAPTQAQSRVPDMMPADRRVRWRLGLALGASLAVALGLAVALVGIGFGKMREIERQFAVARVVEDLHIAAQHAGEVATGLTRRGGPGAPHDGLDDAVRRFRTAMAGVAQLRTEAQAWPGGVAAALPDDLEMHAAGVVAALGRISAAEDAATIRREAAKLAEHAHAALPRGLAPLIEAQARDLPRRTRETLAWAGAATAGAAVALSVIWLAAGRMVTRELSLRGRALGQAAGTIRQAALTDPLTGLPNRNSLLLEVAARLGEGAPVTVFHIDIASFGTVNDTLGREAGDELLVAVGRQLTGLGFGDPVARVDADGFVLLRVGPLGDATAEALAHQIARRLGTRLTIRGHALCVEAAIGIAASEDADLTVASAGDPARHRAERLLANAEIALAAARARGGHARFALPMRQRLEVRARLAGELLAGLDRGEIEPYFQPQIEAATGRLAGVEVLARWRHPVRGLLLPQQFLDIAEGANLARAVHARVVGQALAALAGWRAAGLGVPQIGLNFPAADLRRPGAVDQLLFDIDRAGLAPADVAVEVLETALIGQDDPILASVAQLHAAGISIDIDDFGTGHAAISNLALLGPRRIKIDRSFVTGMCDRPRLLKMTEAMIRLAHTLGIEVLAEGVETQAEWALLTRLGVDAVQGYAIGHAMPGPELPLWLARHQMALRAGKVISAA